MTRVIYSYIGDDERRYVVDYLKNVHDWEPIFFHGDEPARAWINNCYPNAVMHDATAMRHSRFDYSEVGPIVPIDAKVISALSEHELKYLNWLEDTTGWNFSFSERRRYYYDVLKFWNTVINNLKPDLFVAYTWPHLPSDFPLYLLCKYCYSIPVLFLDVVPYLDDNYRTIGCSLEDLSAPFTQLYLSNEKEYSTSEPVKAYLEKLRSKIPDQPKHIKAYFNKLDEAYHRSYLDFLRIIRMLFNGTALQKSDWTFKKNKRPWESDQSKLNNIQYILFKRTLARKSRSLKKYYDTLTEQPNFNDKYIYFAAPYQPEAISNLCPGVFEDPFLILDMISEAIPDDWVIYYKEHPNTFKEADKGALERSRYYFRKVKSYKNVKVIPSEINTFKLIDNSLAVCTAGGTVGWEAIVRRTPALVFGSIWYDACKSVFSIETFEDMQNAVNEINSGYKPDDRDIERYAQAIYQASEKDLIIINDFHRDIRNCPDPKSEMERVAKAFFRAYQNLYEKNEVLTQ